MNNSKSSAAFNAAIKVCRNTSISAEGWHGLVMLFKASIAYPPALAQTANGDSATFALSDMVDPIKMDFTPIRIMKS